jgi:hypothetical protein
VSESAGACAAHARQGGRKPGSYIVGMQTHDDSLRSLTDTELLGRLGDLVRQSHRLEAELIAHLGEVDARRLYLREAAASMFVYATRVLHLSEAEGSRRRAGSPAGCPGLDPEAARAAGQGRRAAERPRGGGRDERTPSGRSWRPGCTGRRDRDLGCRR